MINLIPPQGHRTIRTEYMMRVGATVAMLFSAVAILLTVALIPTYVLVHAQMRAFNAEDAVNTGAADTPDIAEEINRTEAIVMELQKRPETTDTSVFVHAIEAAAPAGVSFRNFSFGSVKDAPAPIQVRGVAARREDLIALKQALEQNALFATALVPISDLAKERDLSFTITITPAKKP